MDDLIWTRLFMKAFACKICFDFRHCHYSSTVGPDDTDADS